MGHRKRRSSAFLTAMLCAVALIMVACGGSGGSTTSSTHTKASADKQVFISGAEAGVADIQSFDPALVQDAFSGSAIDNVFTGLVKIDNNLKVVPQLAASWQISSDNLTYTFTLKPNLKFSDGTQLTSQDVVYSINRALAGATQSPVAPYYLRYIKDATNYNAGKIKTLIGDSLKAPDPNTVVITASKPIPFFLDALAYPTSWVVERSLIDKYGKTWTDHLTEGGGDGPFKVQEYSHNKQIVFVPNPNYYGAQPLLQKVIYPFYKAQDTTYSVYQVNGIDYTQIPLADYSTARTRSDFHSEPQLWLNYYTMNYLQKPFDVTSCRQAFALAINKDLIVRSVWKNAYIATNHIVPQGQYGYNPNLTGPAGVQGTAGDTTKAKQLLQQCMQAQGYASVANFPPITLTYASAGIQAARNEVSAMQQMWQNTLGISVKTDDMDINKLFADEALGSNNPLQFYDGPAWIADYPDPEDWTTLQFDKGQAQNGMSFGQNKGPDAAAQQAVQAQLEAADVMTGNPTAREQAYWKAEQQLVNFVAWMPMEQVKFNYLIKPCVQNFHQNAQGLIDPDQWSKTYISTDTPCATTA
jgi:oligopeptide transport system substrate-binding protein